MATQEEMSRGISDLLKLATDLLDKPDYLNINYESAQNLIRQSIFKYTDLKECPFRDACREQFKSEYECEPEEPIDVRGELD